MEFYVVHDLAGAHEFQSAECLGAGAHVHISSDVTDETTSILTIAARCSACAAVLSSRRYDVDVAPLDLLRLERSVDVDAINDNIIATVHMIEVHGRTGVQL